MPELTPIAQVLLGKLLKTTLFILAVVVALASAGIDMSVLAVFGGAVGVGLGLQKTASNLFSGFILLLDKSIKPGDVIGAGGAAVHTRPGGAAAQRLGAWLRRERHRPGTAVLDSRCPQWGAQRQERDPAGNLEAVPRAWHPDPLRAAKCSSTSALPRSAQTIRRPGRSNDCRPRSG
jgi:hypothetical protein